MITTEVQENAKIKKYAMTVSSRGSAERRQAMVEYLKQMVEVVALDESKESVDCALSAIVTEIKGKEALISTDQKLSKVLERLIVTGHRNFTMIKTLWNQMSTVTLDVIYDQYGSHVLECLIKSTAGVEEVDFEFDQTLSRFCESVASDIHGILSDVRATHVIRQLGVVFGHVENFDAANINVADMMSGMSGDMKFGDQLKIVIESVTLLSCTDFDSFISKPHSSMTIQIITIVAAKRFPELFKVLLEKLNGSEYLINCLGDRVKSKFVESLVCAAAQTPDMLEEFIGLVLPSKPVIATIDGEAIEGENVSSIFDKQYAFGFLQSLIGLVKSDKTFSEFIHGFFNSKRITECVTKGGANGLGVIQRLAEKLVELPLKQTEFVDRLLAAIGITDKDKQKFSWSRLMTLRVSYFGETDIIWDEAVNDSELSPQGCLLMSTMARFKSSAIQCFISNSSPLVDHLASIEFVDSKWFTEVFAGRCLQNMISSTSGFPSGTRKKLIKIVLIGQSTENLTKIALDKRVGSWLITAAWDSCAGDVDLKQKLGEGLIAIENLRELSWKIWKYCGLATFSRRKSDWTDAEKKKAKAHNLLSDIIADRSHKKQRMN